MDQVIEEEQSLDDSFNDECLNFNVSDDNISEEVNISYKVVHYFYHFLLCMSK